MTPEKLRDFKVRVLIKKALSVKVYNPSKLSRTNISANKLTDILAYYFCNSKFIFDSPNYPSKLVSYKSIAENGDIINLIKQNPWILHSLFEIKKGYVKQIRKIDPENYYDFTEEMNKMIGILNPKYISPGKFYNVVVKLEKNLKKYGKTTLEDNPYASKKYSNIEDPLEIPYFNAEDYLNLSESITKIPTTNFIKKTRGRRIC